jgi:hypothetical protein
VSLLIFSFYSRAENVRRYQQHYQEASQQVSLFPMSDATHWSRNAAYDTDPAHFADLQDYERHFRDTTTMSTSQHVRYFHVDHCSTFIVFYDQRLLV